MWQTWAESITRNLDRSMWDAMIKQAPPPLLAHLLRPNASQCLSNGAHSAHMALACVDASMADAKQLRGKWEPFGRLLDGNLAQLEARKSMIQTIQADLAALYPSQAHSERK